jgi:TolB-like protein
VPSARRKWKAIAIGVAAVVLAAAGIAMWRARTVHTERLIAVLPFENNGSTEDDYFADGMTDEVRSRLSAVRGLRVTARGSSAQYTRSRKSPREIGRELGVQYLLAGTVRWMKGPGVNRVRVTPELIDVSNEQSTWSQPYDTVMSDVFAVQANIATRVAEALNVTLAAPVQAQIAEHSASNLDAYDEFLKGEQISDALGATDVMVYTKALPHYERAIELDSGFVRAWSAVARAYALLSQSHPTKEGSERARIAAERVTQLAPGRVESRLAMGSYLRNVKLDYDGARKEFLAGLEHDPNDAGLLTSLATVESSLGHFDDALVHAKQAALVDPRSVASARRVAGTYHDLRRFEEELPA